MLNRFSLVRLFVTPWAVARQTPLSIRFSRQEYWSGLLCPPPGDLPDLGIKIASSVAPALQADSLLLSHLRSPHNLKSPKKERQRDLDILSRESHRRREMD